MGEDRRLGQGLCGHVRGGESRPRGTAGAQSRLCASRSSGETRMLGILTKRPRVKYVWEMLDETKVNRFLFICFFAVLL